MYPSVEMALIQWLSGRYASARVARETDASLQENLPWIAVKRFGGRDDTITLDIASVDIDVYADTWAAAEELARDVRVAMRLYLLGAQITTDSGACTIAAVGTLAAPAQRPTTDPDLKRCGASYRVTTHSRVAA